MAKKKKSSAESQAPEKEFNAEAGVSVAESNAPDAAAKPGKAFADSIPAWNPPALYALYIPGGHGLGLVGFFGSKEAALAHPHSNSDSVVVKIEGASIA